MAFCDLLERGGRSYHVGVFGVNSAGANRFFFQPYLERPDLELSRPSTPVLYRGSVAVRRLGLKSKEVESRTEAQARYALNMWISSIRLSTVENDLLNQIYTEVLINRKDEHRIIEQELLWPNYYTDSQSKPLEEVSFEGRLQCRIAGTTEWKQYWCLIEPLKLSKLGDDSVMPQSIRRARLLFFMDEKDAEKARRKKRGPFAKQLPAENYAVFEVVNVMEAFAMFPDKEDLVNMSTIFKVCGGLIQFHPKADEVIQTQVSSRTNFDGKHNFLLCMATTQAEMTKWLNTIWSCFALNDRQPGHYDPSKKPLMNELITPDSLAFNITQRLSLDQEDPLFLNVDEVSELIDMKDLSLEDYKSQLMNMIELKVAAANEPPKPNSILFQPPNQNDPKYQLRRAAEDVQASMVRPELNVVDSPSTDDEMSPKTANEDFDDIKHGEQAQLSPTRQKLADEIAQIKMDGPSSKVASAKTVASPSPSKMKRPLSLVEDESRKNARTTIHSPTDTSSEEEEEERKPKAKAAAAPIFVFGMLDALKSQEKPKEETETLEHEEKLSERKKKNAIGQKEKLVREKAKRTIVGPISKRRLLPSRRSRIPELLPTITEQSPAGSPRSQTKTLKTPKQKGKARVAEKEKVLSPSEEETDSSEGDYESVPSPMKSSVSSLDDPAATASESESEASSSASQSSISSKDKVKKKIIVRGPNGEKREVSDESSSSDESDVDKATKQMPRKSFNSSHAVRHHAEDQLEKRQLERERREIVELRAKLDSERRRLENEREELHQEKLEHGSSVSYSGRSRAPSVHSVAYAPIAPLVPLAPLAVQQIPYHSYQPHSARSASLVEGYGAYPYGMQMPYTPSMYRTGSPTPSESASAIMEREPGTYQPMPGSNAPPESGEQELDEQPQGLMRAIVAAQKTRSMSYDPRSVAAARPMPARRSAASASDVGVPTRSHVTARSRSVVDSRSSVGSGAYPVPQMVPLAYPNMVYPNMSYPVMPNPYGYAPQQPYPQVAQQQPYSQMSQPYAPQQMMYPGAMPPSNTGLRMGGYMPPQGQPPYMQQPRRQ